MRALTEDVVVVVAAAVVNGATVVGLGRLKEMTSNSILIVKIVTLQLPIQKTKILPSNNVISSSLYTVKGKDLKVHKHEMIWDFFGWVIRNLLCSGLYLILFFRFLKVFRISNISALPDPENENLTSTRS